MYIFKCPVSDLDVTLVDDLNKRKREKRRKKRERKKMRSDGWRKTEPGESKSNIESGTYHEAPSIQTLFGPKNCFDWERGVLILRENKI